MSLRPSTAAPSACSGEKYVAVPMTEPSSASWSSTDIAWAIPKSVTFTWPSLAIKMLPGFTSRWTTPLRCA